MTILTEAKGLADLAQVFVSSKKELETSLKKIKSSLKPSGLLWLTYPKGTSKVKTDINRDIIREYVEANGFKTVSLISVDDTWSALRLKVFSWYITFGATGEDACGTKFTVAFPLPLRQNGLVKPFPSVLS